MSGYLEKGIQTPMAQGRSTKIISMFKWIQTSRLSIKNSLAFALQVAHLAAALVGIFLGVALRRSRLPSPPNIIYLVSN